MQRQAAGRGEASWRRKVGTGKPWQDSLGRKDRASSTARKDKRGQQGQDNLDKTTDRTSRTARTGQSGQDSWDRRTRTGQP